MPHGLQLSRGQVRNTRTCYAARRDSKGRASATLVQLHKQQQLCDWRLLTGRNRITHTLPALRIKQHSALNNMESSLEWAGESG